MGLYRLIFRGDDGSVQRADEFACDDDLAALDHIADELDGRAVELWSGSRLVAEFLKGPSGRGL